MSRGRPTRPDLRTTSAVALGPPFFARRPSPGRLRSALGRSASRMSLRLCSGSRAAPCRRPSFACLPRSLQRARAGVPGPPVSALGPPRRSPQTAAGMTRPAHIGQVIREADALPIRGVAAPGQGGAIPECHRALHGREPRLHRNAPTVRSPVPVGPPERGLHAGLPGLEASIDPVAGHEVLVGAVLGDAVLGEDQDAVSVADRGQPVRDD